MSTSKMLKQARPYLFITMHQFGQAGMSIISKVALNQGISQSVLVVYRHIIATILIAPFAIFFERPVLDQNLYYTGMKYTSATFATAMCNVLPALTFIMAWIFRLEDVNLEKRHSQAKVLGTALTVGGAMFMTVFEGPILNLPWTNNHHTELLLAEHSKMSVKGALMIVSACTCCSVFIILQAVTLKSYPAELSLTAWICAIGVAQGAVVAAALEWARPSAWSLTSSSMIMTALYSGIFRSGFAYYVLGVVMKEKGPVFVTAFYPLGLIIVAILSSFILAEMMYLGMVIGAIIIIVGLYLILWGKTLDNTSSPSLEAQKDEHVNNTSNQSTNIEIKDLEAIDEVEEYQESESNEKESNGS